MGYDRISPKILKVCATSLAGPVTTLFKMCLKNGDFPDAWNIHMITPVPKSGDLSLITGLFHSFESVDFIRPLLSPTEFGFLESRSSIAQLLNNHKCF